MSNIPLDKAEILALFLETILYGIFFTLFWITILFLSQRGKAAKVQRRVLIPAATLMMIVATVHLIIDFVRTLEAFVFKVHLPGGAIAYYENIAHPLHVAKTGIYVVQTILGDSVIIWRCYIVYSRSLYVAIPCLIVMLADFAVGCVTCWILAQAVPGSTVFNTAAAWITTFFVLTMCLNVICTVAIAWRIQASHNSLRRSHSLVSITLVVVESGALYASGVLGLLIAYLSGSNGQYAALDCVTPLVGIAFSLIVLQIHFHLGTGSQSGGTFGTERFSTWKPATQHATTATETLDFPVRSVAVIVSEQIEAGRSGDHLGKNVSEYSLEHTGRSDKEAQL